MNNFENVIENTDGLDLAAINYNIRYASNPLKKFAFNIGAGGNMKEVNNKGTFSRIPDAKESGQRGFANINYTWKRFLIQGSAQAIMKNVELKTYKGLNDTSSSRSAINFKKHQIIFSSRIIHYIRERIDLR